MTFEKNMLNDNQPKTEPWGTTAKISVQLINDLLIFQFFGIYFKIRKKMHKKMQASSGIQSLR